MAVDTREIKIDAPHAEYAASAHTWERIETVLRGDNADVTTFLPYLNPADKSDENRQRNADYRQRAYFPRVAGRTVTGLVGMAFRVDPTVKIPDMLTYIYANADGAGTSIYQQSQAALRSVVSKGRAGLLVDYPVTGGSVSVADMNAGKAVATIRRYEPEQIINWGLIPDGAYVKLGRVVLRDCVSDVYGGVVEVIRELTIENGVYVSREYRRDDDDKWAQYGVDNYPRRGDGQPWTEIPFAFVGAETNTAAVDDAPMRDLCEINVALYRNIADEEDTIHFAGQPQPYINVDGAHIDIFEKMYNENKIYTGIRRAIFIPNGNFGFAAVPPNPLVSEAIKNKINLMVGMGAYFIQPGSAVKTATQSAGEQLVQTSILSLAASNVSEAYSKCLEWMCAYMNIPLPEDANDAYEYAISKDFVGTELDAQALAQLIAGVGSNVIPKSDVWAYLRRVGYAPSDRDDEETRELLDAQAASFSMPDLGGDGGGDDGNNEVQDGEGREQ